MAGGNQNRPSFQKSYGMGFWIMQPLKGRQKNRKNRHPFIEGAHWKTCVSRVFYGLRSEYLENDMRIIEIQESEPELSERLLTVWERSVRATHLFLSDEEIGNIKKYVPTALQEIPHRIVAEKQPGNSHRVYGDRGPESGNAVYFLQREGKGIGATADSIWKGALFPPNPGSE